MAQRPSCPDERAVFLAALEEDVSPLVPGRPRPTPVPATTTEPRTGGAA
ncbi:hypothetical protein Xcel_0571 [Xylanimonas cellulosilytica DSM 15894]|uniref:Uncharacterized protein n=1 Tax=Xylanimonas cellulosilytica (strain DSM 15894 / JCM 12276 / CECT 5975 / KCTC 9989 / LMG 20990 / NBRC 107835 / XIL07) TaxID=446471 RepID=D1BWM8_XYLCX|nr:hypothetical protein [Xylanimonas cellulosilytica]ACZ29610.1 hypothetical protein Xcel_0571 [Xylanimonas cellulosilytica DSM 15894]